ncbi:MAG: DNA translocase FtsK [bacterium]|nr:DNA translocase FtsK [bacterium]
MAKKRGPGRPKGSKNQKSEKGEGRVSRLSRDTKKSILGLLLIGLSLILFLAAFAKAGPAGDFLYEILSKLFGVGYYLVPIICLVVGILFLATHEKKFFSVVFGGMSLFVLSGMGLIDVLAKDKAGLVGSLVGALETPFGRAGSLILLVVLVIASLLVTLNASIKLPWPKKKDEEDLEGEEFDSVAYVEEEKKKLSRQMQMPEPEEEKEIEIAQAEERKGHTEAEFSAALKKNSKSAYVAPPLSLLKSSSEKPTPGDLRANANIIKRTLESFGVPVEMGEINIGPKVTRYTLKPAQGVKINRITALSGDLALALAAHPIRIEAPIPGKSLVGIEVPNKQASIVRLGSLLSYPEFANGKELVWPMGRDVSGEPIFSDIAKLPHLLIAGATGSGKSILIHSILIPMLFKNSPDMLKLILIDPKRVELTVYDGIPHLISPVITEGKKSIAVFRWAINEMDRRYDILMNAGARDIESYNKKNKGESLPYIIMVIDELADLMSTFGKEVEGYIVRLAQMARATGLHLVLATQRPSVEVVTGLIKANMPGRVGLQVASQVDSRTILDASGAEKLLGSGDMLFISKEFSKPKRIQGSFITEKEISDVIRFIEDKNPDLGATEPSEDDGTLTAALNRSPMGATIAGAGPAEIKKVAAKGGDVFDEFMNSSSDDEDDRLDEAIEVVRQAGKASASLLQRRLQVGYARAARILDIMEERELIGPSNGAKPRELYMETEEESKEIGI